jgi:hypothetical protein
MLQKFCHKQNVQCWRKQKEVILKEIMKPRKFVMGLIRRISMSVLIKFWVFVRKMFNLPSFYQGDSKI